MTGDLTERVARAIADRLEEPCGCGDEAANAAIAEVIEAMREWAKVRELPLLDERLDAFAKENGYE